MEQKKMIEALGKKENVIQFKKEGKIITMKVHFTCIEDITKE